MCKPIYGRGEKNSVTKSPFTSYQGNIIIDPLRKGEWFTDVKCGVTENNYVYSTLTDSIITFL